MAKKALVGTEEMPDHPNAPKTVAKKASAHGGVNSFIRGGKGKKGKGKKHHKKHHAK
jgi:hypothetical protein